MIAINNGFLPSLEMTVSKISAELNCLLQCPLEYDFFFNLKKKTNLEAFCLKSEMPLHASKMQYCSSMVVYSFWKTVLLWTEHSLNPEYTGDSRSWHVLFVWQLNLGLRELSTSLLDINHCYCSETEGAMLRYSWGGVVTEYPIKCRLVKWNNILCFLSIPAPVNGNSKINLLKLLFLFKQ